MPKIVILDADPALGSAVNLGGTPLATDELAALGDLVVYSQTAPEDVVRRLSGAEIALTNKVILGRAQLSQAPDLRLISVLATGVNVVDLQAAKDRGIIVSNVPGYSTASTAQHTFALLLELCQRVGSHSAGAKAGQWAASGPFSYFETDLIELQGLTLGVVGYGAIGQRVARLGRAFGMRVLVHTRTPRLDQDVAFVDKDGLLRQSDVVSLHCPLTEETRHYVDGEALLKMKRTALLLNCSRGPLVDECALATALSQDRLAGAGLDVLECEPPAPDNPLLLSPKTVVTPHIAWATTAARARLMAVSAANVRAYLSGAAQNVVGA